MARKHSVSSTVTLTTTKTLHRLSLVGVVDFPVRKLIIFVLLQLVLSPFILITADTLNESTGDSNQATVVPDSGEQQFGSASNVNAQVNGVKTRMSVAKTSTKNCTADGFLAVATPLLNAIERKSANGNSILKPSEIDVNEKRPYDVDLSSTENASIHNQSRQTIDATTSAAADARESYRTKRDGETFNKENGERVLSRKRRYLIFPPGSSLQIGNLSYFSFCNGFFYKVSVFPQLNGF